MKVAVGDVSVVRERKGNVELEQKKGGREEKELACEREPVRRGGVLQKFYSRLIIPSWRES